MQPFVRNLWYLAAWANEVPAGGMLSRKLLGTARVIFQRGDGQWAMLADRCPHRFAPLSRGRRVGDTIRCGYHGLGFDSTGACVHNSFAGGGIPQGAAVESLPIVERHGGLWFWPGDPSKADPAGIPDFTFLEGSPNVFTRLLMDAHYELLTDNLMDLSHAEFLHVESFGTNGSLLNHGKQTVETDDSGAIWNKWDMDAVDPPGWAQPMLQPGEEVDQWIHMRWHAPAAMALSIGLARSATGRRQLVVPAMLDPHILTPETHSTTHYFFWHQATEDARAMAEQVFRREDEPMIRAAFEAMDGVEFWDLKPLILPSDNAALRARRRLMKLRADEDAAPTAA
jgi:phenylpropionate dioxygenase-like ring-hydroxylating dioxygenase large terminal subunit